jgi:hypothetical protein
MIDPFGFSFEHYDGMGAFRSTENGRPIDSAVVVNQRTGSRRAQAGPPPEPIPSGDFGTDPRPAHPAEDGGLVAGGLEPSEGSKDIDGLYGDSNQLAAALASSEAARACFARYVFRAGAATGKPAGRLAEAEFLDLWRASPGAAQGNIVETLIAFVKRPAFVRRRPE